MKKGFTLVELIVVVIIIGVLAAVGVPQLRRTLERARGAEALSGLGHIQSAQKVYYALNERYLPGDIADIQNQLDINIAEENWMFEVSTFDGHQGFIAIAERQGGPCSGEVLVMTEDGMVGVEEGETHSGITIESGSWNACVDDL